MFKVLCRGNLFRCLKNNGVSCKRFFLSNGFKCTEAWENRLNTSVFQKIQLGNLYAELEKKFLRGQSISVLDVDIFVSGIVEEIYKNELEDIVLKIRANPETSIMYERTSHAAIRCLLSWNKKEDLLDILSQRLVYGLFPDEYLSILMMDTFFKENDVVSAMKIAVLQMLQEDCNYPILNGLSLYLCIKYLNSSNVWSTPPKEVIDEDEEVVKVRVDFVRNDHHDDHFDIVNTNHLIGKTMYAFGRTIDEPIRASCQLIGLVLYEKYDQAKALASNVLSNKLPIHKEAVEKAKSYTQKKPKQSAEDEKSEESKTDGDGNEELPIKTELLKLLDTLSNQSLLPDPLETVLEEYVKKDVRENEEMYIKKQCEKYKKWEEDRAKNIEEETMENKKRSVKIEIEELKKQLQLEEQRLFYYDNEVDNEEIVEENRIEKANFRYFVPKKGKKHSSQDVYIPPRV